MIANLNHPCRGSDKEQYEPTILRLLSHDRTRASIRDIWAIDFPNHGETASLNRTILDARKEAGKGVCSAFRPPLVYIYFPHDILKLRRTLRLTSELFYLLLGFRVAH